MISKRFMELRRRRGLMIALAVVTIGIPSIFLIIRLLAHAFAPKTYGPAGGYDIFTALVSGVLFIFGFIVAAALGCTAGSIDLQEGVFRHLVVTGRSRVAIYFARIPAGLAIVVAFVAIGYGIVCLVCSFAAPTVLNYDGVNVPAGLSQRGLDSWASSHADEVICNFNLRLGPSGPGPSSSLASVIQNVPCNDGPGRRVKIGPPGSQGAAPQPTESEIRAAAVTIANLDYSDYSRQFLSPSDSLMIRTGLWIELEAAIGFIVGLGLGSLTGQRTISVILMIVLELILTPLFLRAHIPHMINFQRSIVGVATDHLGPSAIPVAMGGGPSDRANIISETRTWAAIVVAAWVVAWTALGAWRMASRDT
jgi:hypothetical protein